LTFLYEIRSKEILQVDTIFPKKKEIDLLCSKSIFLQVFFELVIHLSKVMFWVGSFICCLGRVGSATYGFGKFPLKIPNFQFFSLWIKKTFSGQVKKYSGQRWFSPLFILGRKYAGIGSVQWQSLM